jgi:pimeloyl-ACP methyl ester carboxylesterase
MKMSLRSLGASVVAGVLAAATLSGVASAKPGGHMPGSCFPFHAPVALAEGQPLSQEISGTYCEPSQWEKGKHKIDVLTAGATYNASYWDWAQDPSLYSYVRKTLVSGRATLAYDRLGSGQSSHPVSTDITLSADVWVLHSIVHALRLIGYKEVDLINHSYGSGIAVREASLYADVDRVVLTGYLHAGRNPIVAAATYSANQDPLFAGAGLDNGYLTSTPATSTSVSGRQAAFYSTSADQSVINFDDQHKDLVSTTGFGGYFADKGAPAGANLSNKIKVPVLLIDGQQDAVFCFSADLGGLDCNNSADLYRHEVAYYTDAESLTIDLVPDTGHDLTLHPSAGKSFRMIDHWISTH